MQPDDYVLISKQELERLEATRAELWKQLEGRFDLTLDDKCAFQNITNVMWLIANTKRMKPSDIIFSER